MQTRPWMHHGRPCGAPMIDGQCVSARPGLIEAEPMVEGCSAGRQHNRDDVRIGRSMARAGAIAETGAPIRNGRLCGRFTNLSSKVRKPRDGRGLFLSTMLAASYIQNSKWSGQDCQYLLRIRPLGHVQSMTFTLLWIAVTRRFWGEPRRRLVNLQRPESVVGGQAIFR